MVFQFLKSVGSEWAALRRFARATRAGDALVFYAEGPADWPHFEAIVGELTGTHGLSLLYVTSDARDPVLDAPPRGVTPFCVGSGGARTVFFQSVAARVVVMTLPDLDTFHLKRSVHPSHYVYLFHAISSTHRVYRRGAFDAYDTILCVGPHHVEEIRETERVYGLPPKRLVEHGYGRLDAILTRARDLPPFVPSEGSRKRVVVAPSWGECSLLEQSYGVDVLRILLDAGHDVTLRLHPMTVRHRSRMVEDLRRGFTRQPGFTLELDMRAQESLQRADLMIGDWSGAATEFAFGLERPVLSIDTPPKINNPEHGEIASPPLEDRIRREIGEVVSPRELSALLPAVVRLAAPGGEWAARIRQARARWIFNPGRSGAVGAETIAAIYRGAAETKQLEAVT